MLLYNSGSVNLPHRNIKFLLCRNPLKCNIISGTTSFKTACQHIFQERVPLILKTGVKGGNNQRRDLTQNKKYQNSTQHNNTKKMGRFIILNEKSEDRTRHKMLVTG